MTISASPDGGHSGPFATEDQVLASPAVQGIYARMRANRDYRMQDGSAEMIFAACALAGVELGDYDVRIIRWVAGFEPQSSAVLAGLITRAGAAKPDAEIAGDDGPRCAQCGALAGKRPDPYGGRPLWRHKMPRYLADVAAFLDAEHTAIPREVAP